MAQFARTRLIFSRINGSNETIHFLYFEMQKEQIPIVSQNSEVCKILSLILPVENDLIGVIMIMKTTT